MDLLRLAVRALFVFAFLLVMLRLAGKRTIRQASPFDFVFALILGDLIDNAVWAEVPISEFVTAAATLIGVKLAMDFRALHPRLDQ
jgi:uncharacterized membrane protein YcaP (DUF421 family)